jgi:hypothetical protein
MKKPVPTHRLSLGTMLILSAIDVLLCSFTAGVALFLMGEPPAKAGGAVGRDHSLTRQYLYIELPPFDERMCKLWNSFFIRIFCRESSQEEKTAISFKLADHCTKRNGNRTWVVECGPEVDSEVLATISLSRAAMVSVRVVSQGQSFACGGQIEAITAVPIGTILVRNASEQTGNNLRCHGTSR